MPAEYRALWSTPGGGNGFSVFHFTDASSGAVAQNIADATKGFFDAIKGIFPEEVTISFDDEVRVLDAAGTLITTWSVSPPAAVTGINAATYNRAAGMRVDWTTGVVVAGRRLSGRTYLVPCGASVFDGVGLVTAANVTAVTGAANAFRAALPLSGKLRVWSRTHATDAEVTGQSVPIKGAILRGRRD